MREMIWKAVGRAFATSSFWGACIKVDNTVRENKNTNMLLYMAYLVGKLDLHVTSLCFLRKGHTHTRLGHHVTG